MKLKHFYGAIFISALATALDGLVIDRANAVVLTFEGLQDNERVQNFYNGGSGPNYGIAFNTAGNGSGGTAQRIDANNGPNFSNPPSATVLFFEGNARNNNTLNVANGFTSTFSFDYGSTANRQQTSRVSIFDGLNGTGTRLGFLDLSPTTNGAGIDTWIANISIAFAGTARSAVFDVVSNQVGFDNININLVNTTAVPEPFTVIGTIVGGTAALRMRKKLKATNKD